MLYKKLFFLQCFSTKSTSQFESTKKLMPELTTKAFVWINMQGDRRSTAFLGTKKIRTPHLEDDILILQKVELKLTSKGPGLQPITEKILNNTFWQGERYFLRSNSMSKAHFAQLLQTRHTPRLTGDVRCKFYTFINLILMQVWSNISHVHTLVIRLYISLKKSQIFILLLHTHVHILNI